MQSRLTSYTNTQLDSIITKGLPYIHLVSSLNYSECYVIHRNFIQFYSTKSERDLNLRKEYDNQMEYRKHLQAFIDRWRYNANRGMYLLGRLFHD
jgi:ATPase subunit of ABC transporter with duplicated ATPase domains